MSNRYLIKIIPTLILSLCLLPPSLQAAIFNPTDANGLQADLNTAAANGEDDTINLPATTLNTNDNGAGATFTYSSAEDNHLTLVGQGSDVSRLDGNNARTVLDMDSSGANAQIILMNLGLVNGDGAAGGIAGGLQLSVSGGGFSITQCLFDNNNQSTGSFGAMNLNSDGPGTFEDNTVSNSTVMNAFAFGSVNINNGAVTIFNRNIISNMQSTTGAFAGPTLNADGPLTYNDNSLSDLTSFGSFAGGNINGSESIDFNGNTFLRAQSMDGSFGGININSGGPATITQNTYTDGGAMSSFGGPNINASQSLNFSNNTIQGITAADGPFGGFNLNTDGPLTFNNNRILNNQALSGFSGGNINTANTVEMLNNTISGNQATMGNFGGIIVNLDAFPANIANNIIVNNQATGITGGMSISANDGTTLDFINNTLSGNTSGDIGGGLNIVLDSDNTVINLFNNIVFGNTATNMADDIYINNISGPNAPINLFNNDFSEICFNAQGTCDFTVLGPNQGANIDADPLFVDAPAGNYYLSAGSPAIDTGTSVAPNLPATDHDGNPRIFGPEPDMGALESLPMLMVDPLSHDFGSLEIDQEDSVVITLTNNGTVALDVSAMNLSDAINYILNVNGGPSPCGTDSPTLNPGESCTVEIFFSPDIAGNFNAILTIISNDPNLPSVEVTLFGIATATGAVFFSGGSCALNSTLAISENQALPWALLMVALAVMGWHRRRA